MLSYTLGYRRTRHLGRWMNVLGDGDGLGDEWSHNGERMLFDGIVAAADESCVILEVGAHDGSHTLSMLRSLHCAKRNNIIIHSFEPSAHNRAKARAALDASSFRDRAILNMLACSDQIGEAALRCRDDFGGGTNSLHDTELASGQGQHIEKVPTVTLDEYCRASNIRDILFLKIDAEGHDLRVLRGAVNLLKNQHIKYVQFEYNATWIASRSFLRDAFELLQGQGYQIGKVHLDFVEQFAQWDYRLEWFEHTNYVAWLPAPPPQFPTQATDQYLAHRAARA